VSSLADDVHEESGRELRDLRAILKTRDAELAGLRQKLDLVTSIDQARLAPPKWMAPSIPKRGYHGTVCLMLTDTHFGEVVNPMEVEGLNAYDDAIADKRMQRFTEKGIRLGRTYASGLEVDGAVLFIGGDIFTGTIHDELLETNSETLYASVVRWLDPLAAMMYALADAYGRLHIAVTYGNHGRRTRKPRAKLRAQDNIEWLFYKVLERETHDDKRITWQVPDSADTRVNVYGTRYLLTHGDQFRGGSGIAGALSPLMLGSARKTRRAMTSGKPYDVMVMGHWHSYWTLPGPIIVGGTMKGLDEYSYVGNFAFEQPTQAFWVTTPEVGVTAQAPIFVADREAEGW
jgi:hypothetical protein